MLLTVSVGNARTVLGVMRETEVVERRVVSTREATADEWAQVLSQQLPDVDVTAAIVSCVVPSALYAVKKAVLRAFGIEARVVGKGLKTGLKLRTDNPREVGSDRIVNAVAAVHTYGAPVVVVRFGTALTVDCVNAKGEYSGSLETTKAVQLGDYFKINSIKGTLDKNGDMSADFDIEVVNLKMFSEVKLKCRIDKNGFKVISAKITVPFGNQKTDKAWGSLSLEYSDADGFKISGTVNIKLKASNSLRRIVKNFIVFT